MTTKATSPTPEEERAIEAMSRAMSPDEWAEYDAGNGVCTNQCGWALKHSIIHAKRLIRAFPGIVQIIVA